MGINMNKLKYIEDCVAIILVTRADAITENRMRRVMDLNNVGTLFTKETGER